MILTIFETLLGLFLTYWLLNITIHRLCLNHWRNHLLPNQNIIVRCYYYINDHQKYTYIPATISERVDGRFYTVIYDPDYLQAAVDNYGDFDLITLYIVNKNTIFKPCDHNQLEKKNNNWD